MSRSPTVWPLSHQEMVKYNHGNRAAAFNAVRSNHRGEGLLTIWVQVVPGSSRTPIVAAHNSTTSNASAHSRETSPAYDRCGAGRGGPAGAAGAGRAKA